MPLNFGRDKKQKKSLRPPEVNKVFKSAKHHNVNKKEKKKKK